MVEGFHVVPAQLVVKKMFFVLLSMCASVMASVVTVAGCVSCINVSLVFCGSFIWHSAPCYVPRESTHCYAMDATDRSVQRVMLPTFNVSISLFSVVVGYMKRPISCEVECIWVLLHVLQCTSTGHEHALHIINVVLTALQTFFVGARFGSGRFPRAHKPFRA